MNYKFVWKERAGIVVKEFKSYFTTELYSNVAIYTGEIKCPIRAHSLVLASLGGHISHLLKQEAGQSVDQHKIIIPDVSRSCLLEALSQVYSGNLTKKYANILEEIGLLDTSANIVVKREEVGDSENNDDDSSLKIESEQLSKTISPFEEVEFNDNDIAAVSSKNIASEEDFPSKVHRKKPKVKAERKTCIKIETPYVEEHLKKKDCGCNIVFKSRQSRLFHLRLEHSQLPSFPCTTKGCKRYIFSSKNSLHKHLRKKHNHECDESCQLNVEVAEKLNTRKEKKKEDAKKRNGDGCFCEVCGKKFRNFTNMNAHKIASHEPNQTWPCPDCGKVFQHSNNLRIHKKQMHSTERFLCQTCATEFKSRKNLRNHIYSNHTPEENKRHVCTLCPKPKGFATKGKFEMHCSSVHFKNTPYACRYQCGRAYNDGSNRNAHEKKTHGSLHISALISLQERNCLPEALPQGLKT